MCLSLIENRSLLGIRPHCCVFVVLLAFNSVATAEMTPTEALSVITSVDTNAAGMKKASEATQSLRRLPIEQLPVLLDAISGADPVSKNWIRGVVFDVMRRGEQTPLEMLRDYVADQANGPDGRGLAMELIQQDAPEIADELIGTFVDDPSLPLRQMAITQLIDKAETAQDSNQDDFAIKLYRQALNSARHPRQLETAVNALKDLGQQASVADAFAMITNWKTIGPFDNVAGVGFEAVYSPEQRYVESQDRSPTPAGDGKPGEVSWKEISGDPDSGLIDLNAAFDREKGGCAYLFTTFRSPTSGPAQARLRSVTANKVWVNGREVMANEVYHSGTAIDQYVADVDLREGDNTILLKICQNEQTEGWAQVWEFQFRLSNPNGKGLVSAN